MWARSSTQNVQVAVSGVNNILRNTAWLLEFLRRWMNGFAFFRTAASQFEYPGSSTINGSPREAKASPEDENSGVYMKGPIEGLKL